MSRSLAEKNKRLIGNIGKHVEALGLEKIQDASISNSTYYKGCGIKIRVSDHIAPAVGSEKINVVITHDIEPRFITVVNGGVMIHNSLKELKSFLSASVRFMKCKVEADELILDNEIAKKKSNLEVIKKEVKKASYDQDKLTKQTRIEREKLAKQAKLASDTLAKIDRLKAGESDIDISGLTNKQKSALLTQIQNFKLQ